MGGRSERPIHLYANGNGEQEEWQSYRAMEIALGVCQLPWRDRLAQPIRVGQTEETEARAVEAPAGILPAR